MLREVARRAGVSHNAAYRHFSDREQLLSEVAAVGMAALAESMQERVAAIRTRDAGWRARRPVARGRHGVRRVRGHRTGTVPGCVLPDRDRRPGLDAGRRALPPPRPGARQLVKPGALSPAGREGADVACWAAVHGLSVLLLDGPLRGLPPADREAALEKLLVTIEQGLTGSMG